MQKRSLFDRLLGRYNDTVGNKTRFSLMGNYSAVFSEFNGDIYSSDIVRACIHTFATHASKAQAKHIRKKDGLITNVSSEIEYLLTKRPNPHMSAYDFVYKVASQRETNNNAYILIQAEMGKVVGLYPIDYSTLETLEYKDETYVRFRFRNGRELTVPYSEVIHLRKFFNKDDMYGESNYSALQQSLEVIHVTNQGISNMVKSSANIRGILKFTTAMLSAKDLKQQRDDFINDYLDINNNGGVVATDTKADYIPIQNEPKIIDAQQMELLENKIYSYFNTNRAIVTSKFTDEEWAAYYESVLEPFFIQFGLELTTKLFTKKELEHGNEIIFTTNKLQYATTEKKLAVVTALIDRGLMSKNQGLEVFNLPPIEDGDKYIMSLNFVDASIANEYQLGKKTEVLAPQNVDNKDNANNVDTQNVDNQQQDGGTNNAQ